MVDSSDIVSRFGQSYIRDCGNSLKGSDTNGDGKVTLEEFKNNLSIFGDNNLNQRAKDLMDKYADADGSITAEGYAQWLNSEEYGQILDEYHSSKEFSEIEMGWIENSQNSYQDGQVTKGEVKVDLLNRLPDGVDGSEMEALIDKYAGQDGVFTVEEYTKLKNDPEFKAFLKEHGIHLGTGKPQSNNGNNFGLNFNNNFNFNMSNFNFGNFNFNNFNMNAFFNSFFSMFKLQ